MIVRVVMPLPGKTLSMSGSMRIGFPVNELKLDLPSLNVVGNGYTTSRAATKNHYQAQHHAFHLQLPC